MSVAVVGLAVTAIGTGLSVWAQSEAASSADAIANYNAQIQRENAEMQLLALEAQRDVAEQQAHAEFRMRQAQAEARFSNARLLARQAEVQADNDRESISRHRDSLTRIAEQNRAAIARSGVVESTGSPLDVIAETAEHIQGEVNDRHYLSNIARSDMFREADLERLGGELALAGATLDRSSQIAGAGLRYAAGRINNRAARREAELTRLTGQAQADNLRNGALTSLFSGLNRIGGQYQQGIDSGSIRPLT